MVDHQLLATIRSSPLLLKDNTKPNAQMPLRRLQKMCSPETNRHCGFFFFPPNYGSDPPVPELVSSGPT